MLHWVWDIAKRHPTRALMFGGVALLVSATVHVNLLEKWTSPRNMSGNMEILVVTMALADGMCGLVALAIIVAGALRIYRGKP